MAGDQHRVDSARSALTVTMLITAIASLLGAQHHFASAYHERDAELVWEQLGHLKTSKVGEVLEHAVRRIERTLRRRGSLASDVSDESDEKGDASEARLAASAVSGQTPPALAARATSARIR